MKTWVETALAAYEHWKGIGEPGADEGQRKRVRSWAADPSSAFDAENIAREHWRLLTHWMEQQQLREERERRARASTVIREQRNERRHLLSEELRAIRSETGLTQDELAAVLKEKRVTLAAAEAGGGTLSVDRMSRMLDQYRAIAKLATPMTGKAPVG